MGRKGFKELNVWKKAKDMAVYIYKLTNSGAFANDFGLRDQMRRSAVSIASNIKDSARFLYIAKGSLAELVTQIEIAKDIGYLTNEEFKYIYEECEVIGRMLGRLIKFRSQSITRNP